MASFITRVELHGASQASEYQALHLAMSRQGFTRTIVGGDGREHQLPTAEYLLVGSFTVDQVREKAKVAAATVKQGYEILVVEIANWSGYLSVVSARRAG